MRALLMVASPPRRAHDARRLGLLLLPVVLIGAGWPARTAEAEEPEVTFRRLPAGLQIDIGGRPFARYLFESGPIPRPFFEHLHAPVGTQVTRNNPPVEGKDLTDHPTFHPGLWLAFGDLNGVDYWRTKDRIRHVGFVEEPKGSPGRGAFAVRNRYEKDSEVIGEEVCRLTIAVCPAGYLLIWDSQFHPKGGDLVFGDQEEMGLGIRMATPLAVVNGGRIIDSEGRINEAQVWGKQADWCAYGGEIDGKQVGVLLMLHPKNFRRSWFHARDYGLLVANPFGRNAFTKSEKSRVVIHPGEVLRLRFGVLIYGGPAESSPDLSAAYQDYLRLSGDE
ncbi:MAG: PmoA family protein [Isosphaeraceae bacterium]|nr:PmoA family protein [Isosphaeraceae bacterium]